MSKKRKSKKRRQVMSVSEFAARKHEAEDKALDKKFRELSGPVVVRKIGDPKPDYKENK